MHKPYVKKSRLKECDIDYFDQLEGAEAKFMEKFIEEFYNGSISRIDPLHNTKELRKSVYDRHNAASRDILHKYRTSPPKKRKTSYTALDYDFYDVDEESS